MMMMMMTMMRGRPQSVEDSARAREDMSTVEITPETQKHPLAVMLMLGCKAAPIVAYVAMRRARDE